MISVAKSLRFPGIGVLPVAVRVTIEVPRGSFVKRSGDGRVDFISPLPCPFNYGCIVGTTGADGEPLDALTFGPALRFGTEWELPVRGVMGFVDGGLDDPKVVCSETPLDGAQRRQVERFFWVYAQAKRAAYRLWGGSRGLTAVSGWLGPEQDELATPEEPSSR